MHRARDVNILHRTKTTYESDDDDSPAAGPTLTASPDSSDADSYEALVALESAMSSSSVSLAGSDSADVEDLPTILPSK